MIRVTSIHPTSTANLLALFYGIFGFLYMLQSAFRPGTSIYIPLGLALPFLGVKLNVTAVFPFSLVAPICYAISGWISGMIAAMLYNAAAIYFGGIRVSVAQQPTQASDSPLSTVSLALK